MSENKTFDPKPTARFSGLAEVYAKARPSYPPEAIAEIIERARLTSSSQLVDVGAGTGISARLFAEKDIPVIALEPNEDMRVQAEKQPISSGKPQPKYIAASAEQTTLPDSNADAILCAQSFHWFNSQATLIEFHRILKSRGVVALIWNERDESDAFTAAYGKVIRSLQETESVEVPRGKAGLRLMESELFIDREKVLYKNSQTLTEDGLVDRSFSASYSPRGGDEALDFEKRIRDVFREFAHDEQTVVLRYETSVYFATKP